MRYILNISCGIVLKLLSRRLYVGDFPIAKIARVKKQIWPAGQHRTLCIRNKLLI